MLALAGLALLALAGTASAADEDKPVVICPEDIPGADVIVFYGDSYRFDVSMSYDPKGYGIAYFTIEFKDGGSDINLWSDDGIEDYTFMMWGQTWVTVTAYNLIGDKGVGFFSIDVVEVIDYDADWISEYRVIDHSLYFQGTDLNVDGSTVVFDEGAGAGPAGGGGGVSDMLCESLTPTGSLPGSWQPYYYGYYGNGYGYISADYGYKMSGEMSVKVTQGSWGYSYGWEYKFTTPADLSMYNAFTFWYRNTYNSNYIYIYLYGADNYNYPYAYSYNPGLCNYAMNNGWYGVPSPWTGAG